MIQITWWGFTIVILVFWCFGVVYGYALGRSRRELTQQEIKDAFMGGLSDAAKNIGKQNQRKV